jgi:hypothetical protein
MKILKSNPIPTCKDALSRPIKIDKSTKEGKKPALHKDIVWNLFLSRKKNPLGETSIKIMSLNKYI